MCKLKRDPIFCINQKKYSGWEACVRIKQPPINKMSVSECGKAHIMQISQTVCVCSALGLDHTVPVYGHLADSSDPCQVPITQLLNHFTSGWSTAWRHGGLDCTSSRLFSMASPSGRSPVINSKGILLSMGYRSQNGNALKPGDFILLPVPRNCVIQVGSGEI